MARVQHDSQLEFVLHGPSPNDPFLAGDGLPVLDLTSQGPLPFELDTLAPAELARNAKGSKEKGPISHLLTKSQQDVYLEGDVLLCPCPDCQAPMSVRLWLMVADCWQCGTSIELTEQQERAARDLLSQRGEKRTPARAPIAPKSIPLAHSTPGPNPRPPPASTT